MIASNHISVTISGRDTTARAIKLRDLIELLSDLERALMSTAGASRVQRDFQFSLVGIDDQLARLHFDADEAVRMAAEKIAAAIGSKKSESLPQPATASIRDIHKRATKRGWSITLNNGEFSSTIDPAVPVFTDPLIMGSTTLYGTVVSVGGRRPTAKIELPEGKSLTAEIVNKELAQRLGQLLYRTVTLEGDAWWYSASLELSRFRIREIGAFDATISTPTEAFAALRAISGTVWDDVDPDEYVQDLRAESVE